MDQIAVVEQISEDFEQRNPPFDEVTFPEERLLEELPHNSMEDRAILVSMFASLDWNRNANQLVDNIIELHGRFDSRFFDAKWLTESSSEEALSSLMEDVGFRYPNRDAHSWYTNCKILGEKYSYKWTELYLSVGSDAPDLVERLREDDFLYVKGDKIAPMYARIINDYVAPLDNLWMLEIPVDTHIARLTQELTDTDMTNDEIRTWWGVIGQQADISLHVVDGGLWHIGNKWDEWGKDYWEKVTNGE